MIALPSAIRHNIKPALIFSCLFWIATKNLDAQPYLPMAVEDATWIVNFSDDDFTYNYYYAYKVHGDTLFEGSQFKKLYFIALEDNVRDPYQFVSSSLLGFIRDDTLNGKVFFVGLYPLNYLNYCYTIPPSEVLLYDSAIAVGDTVTDCRTESGMYGPDIVSALSEEFVFLENRRIWDLSYSFSLIEGVGFNRGPFTQSDQVVSASYGTWLIDYCIGTNFECGLYTATSGPRPAQIQIYPNPTDHILHLSGIASYTPVVIYNSAGQEMRISSISNPTEIDVSRLEPGLYLLRATDTQTRPVFARFIKN